MSDDLAPLQERIGRAMYARINGLPWMWERLAPEFQQEYLDDAAAVLPIIAAEVRKAQADALREAADGLMENIDWSDGRSSYGDNEGYEASARELRARAADIEQED